MQLLLVVLVLTGLPFPVEAGADADADLYHRLTRAAAAHVDTSDSNHLFAALNALPRQMDWALAEEKRFSGHLRLIRTKASEGGQKGRAVYLLRELKGALYLLDIPEDRSALDADSATPYAGLEEKFQNKLNFHVSVLPASLDGHSYRLVRLIDAPVQPKLDRVFKLCIILMLFLVMVGMGLTLTFKDFALVFTKPRGIIIGEILQFGLMPLLALVLGHLLGFYRDYPFIFVGMVLITAIPGGVTSNLMTYYAKGDLALSISLTSFSTVLSIVFTPLLLALYCAHMPEVNIPVKTVAQTILILVLVPLAAGMSLRGKWPRFAERSTPFFSALGIFALLALIIAGVLNNIHVFKDTARYGVKFYSTVFALTLSGMFLGVVLAKLARINNYQTRAISLETGLRNSALAMTIALLIQDAMGDFYSSMFVTAGVFGLIMYLAGMIAIFLYRPLLPLGAEAISRKGKP